ncbi:hypothetical protein [Streptomyces sp. NPDC058086]|uniref:hypothetical protein n=1 Tax=Streptomyces sp. NPDC058086 TaxID=3346334 RepID=UPI0036F0F2A1
MSAPDRGHKPSLGGAAEWLISEPLGRPEPRGHVVLVLLDEDVHQPAARAAVHSCVVNQYWLAPYFVDADDIIRVNHFGEGRQE